MIATVINTALVIAGSVLGLLLKNRLKERYAQTILYALALCVSVIGISNALKSENILTMIICLAAGSLLGELLKIEERLDRLGGWLKRKIVKNGDAGSFTEGFVSASLLFCVGSMAIMGSLEAGINQNYFIILSKGVIDGITAVTFAAAMGVGVVFSGFAVLFYQGALTLLAVLAAPYLSASVVTEMSAVGGAMLIAIAINMLELPKDKIRVGNMLPAIFLPIVYLPLATWIGNFMN